VTKDEKPEMGEACGGGKSAGELGWPVIWQLGRRRWGKVEVAHEGRPNPRR
jgi:hypothetical protein